MRRIKQLKLLLLIFFSFTNEMKKVYSRSKCPSLLKDFWTLEGDGPKFSRFWMYNGVLFNLDRGAPGHFATLGLPGGVTMFGSIEILFIFAVMSFIVSDLLDCCVHKYIF